MGSSLILDVEVEMHLLGCSVWPVGRYMVRGQLDTDAPLAGRIDLDDPDLDAALAQNDLGPRERGAPDRIFKGGAGRVEAGDSGIDDRAGAVDAREERRGEASATPRSSPIGMAQIS